MMYVRHAKNSCQLLIFTGREHYVMVHYLKIISIVLSQLKKVDFHKYFSILKISFVHKNLTLSFQTQM